MSLIAASLPMGLVRRITIIIDIQLFFTNQHVGEVMSVSGQLSGSNRRFTFSCENLPNDTFEVVRFEGEDALSSLYRFEIWLASSDSSVDERRVVDWQAKFTLNDGVSGGSDTTYQGLVDEFTIEHQLGDCTLYKAVLVPRLAQLDTHHLSEVYLEKTRAQIFEHLFNSAGLSITYTENRLKVGRNELPVVWNYVCQYQESYLNFLARWCERLGIYWWFEDVDGEEKAIFSDHRFAHKDEAISLRYQPAGVLDADVLEKRRLQSLIMKSQRLPKQVTVMDYNPHRAGMPDIRQTATVDDEGRGDIYVYGQNLKNNEDALYIAKLRAEALRCRSAQYYGSSSATGLRSGQFVAVQDHFRAAFNRRYLLTAIKHRGSQKGLLRERIGHIDNAGDDFYTAEFTAIPSDTQFRPDMTHPWPKIEGCVHAFIDAEDSGKYAELNEKGEYKVQVPFDITEKGAYRGSAWIRMATPYAGSNHGMHFPLHKGTEVLLSFINGDPDQPVIIGAVPNSINPSPVVNLNQVTSRIVTAGGQEIQFCDQESNKFMLLKSSDNCWIRFGPQSSDSSSPGDHSPSMMQMCAASVFSPIPISYQQRYTFGAIQMGAYRLDGTAPVMQMQQPAVYPVNHILPNPAQPESNTNTPDGFQLTAGSAHTKISNWYISETGGERCVNTAGNYSAWIGGNTTNTYDGFVMSHCNNATLTTTLIAKMDFAPISVSSYAEKTDFITGNKNELWSISKNEFGYGVKLEFRYGDKCETWGGYKKEFWSGIKKEVGGGSKSEEITGYKNEKIIGNKEERVLGVKSSYLNVKLEKVRVSQVDYESMFEDLRLAQKKYSELVQDVGMGIVSYDVLNAQQIVVNEKKKVCNSITEIYNHQGIMILTP
jgi:type VI secretion system VgrG family protein